MKNIRWLSACMLVFVLLMTCASVAADTPPPTPTRAPTPIPPAGETFLPTPQPPGWTPSPLVTSPPEWNNGEMWTVSDPHISNQIRAYYYDGDFRNTLEIAFICSNEGGIMADGILMFSPLHVFLEHDYSLPTVTADGSGPLYQVTWNSSYIDRFTETVRFYEPNDEGFLLMQKEDGGNVELAGLEPGEYLMEISISAGRGKEYYSGACFIHVVIPGESGTLPWPIAAETATPTPTLIPTPTPTPTPTICP